MMTQIHARCRGSHVFPDVPFPFLLQNHTKGAVTQAFEDPAEVTVIFNMRKDMLQLFAQAFRIVWICSVSVFPLKISVVERTPSSYISQ